MATWTQSDIDSLKKAIAGGVLEVSFEGPPARRVRYQDLAAMRALLAEMTASVTQQAGQPNYRLAAVRKGV